MCPCNETVINPGSNILWENRPTPDTIRMPSDMDKNCVSFWNIILISQESPIGIWVRKIPTHGKSSGKQTKETAERSDG